MKCNTDEINNKMESLLASYRRKRQKSMYTKSGSSTDNTYNLKWFAYKSMSSLIDKYKPRKTFDTNQINTVSCIKLLDVQSVHHISMFYD
nr:unnamed protein product [Callosobruchus analis]